MKVPKKSGVIYLAATVVLTASFIVLMIMRGDQDQSFPQLPPGEYGGYVTGLFPGDDGVAQKIPIYIEVDDRLLFTLLREGWIPTVQEVQNNENDIPLELHGAEARLRFSGLMEEDGRFEGVVYNLDLNTKGRWSVSRLDSTPSSDEPVDQSERNSPDKISRILLLRDELRGIENQIDDTDRDIEDQVLAVKKFEDFISDGQTLQNRTKEKLEKTKAIYESEAKIFNQKKKEARELAKQLVLSERVTETGNLVSLSRKTIERENRWLDSMFDTSTASSSYDFESEYERAKKIVILKEKIAKLKASGLGSPTSGSVDKSRSRPINTIWDLIE